MKTLKQIIKSDPIFLHDFAGQTTEYVMKEFSATHTTEKLLIASYTYEDYSGSAWVLFSKDGKLYEVYGSHCSCYGLEDQWTPEEVCLPELVNRVTKGKGEWVDECGSAIKTILGLL